MRRELFKSVRCCNHGGMSTRPRTPEGKEAHRCELVFPTEGLGILGVASEARDDPAYSPSDDVCR